MCFADIGSVHICIQGVNRSTLLFFWTTVLVWSPGHIASSFRWIWRYQIEAFIFQDLLTFKAVGIFSGGFQVQIMYHVWFFWTGFYIHNWDILRSEIALKSVLHPIWCPWYQKISWICTYPSAVSLFKLELSISWTSFWFAHS